MARQADSKFDSNGTEDCQPTETTRRYPKRKRSAVSDAIDWSEIDKMLEQEGCSSSTLDDESDVPVRKQRRRRPATRTAKRRREQTFPFLQLPPELRVLVYKYTLADPESLHIQSYKGFIRRFVKRCLPIFCTSKYRGVWINRLSIQDQVAPLPLEPLALEPQHTMSPLGAVSLLTISKTVYAEAVELLYSKELIFPDTAVLQEFLMEIGRDKVRLLRKIRINQWNVESSRRGYNVPAFYLLQDAVNLQRLHINCEIGIFNKVNPYFIRRTNPTDDKSDELNEGHAVNVARKLYQDCFPWLHAMNRAHGLRNLASVLQLQEKNLVPPKGTNIIDSWSRRLVTEAQEIMYEEIEVLVETFA